MFSLHTLYIALGCFAIGALLTFIYFYFRDKWFMSVTRQEAAKLLEKAKSESERLEKESKIQLKEQTLQMKMEMEKESREKNKDLQVAEKRLLAKEENLDKRMSLVDAKEEKNKKTEDELVTRESKVKDEMQLYKNKVQEAQKKLETLTGMTTEEAKRLQVELIVTDAKHEAARHIKQIEEDTKEEADKKAKFVISTAIQRYAGEYVAERTISTVNLPSDELKGRIIGREGRNIRAIEAATGVDLIIDDTPETVVISSFDPLRREAARLSIERLIADGRIHPGRIEEIVEKVKKELDKEVRETGEQAMFEVGVHGIHPELLKLIGALKYRTSYSQNQYVHSMEVAFLAGAMAGELGVDVKMAKRAALLHDIGKAIDHSVEGSHAQIGADMAKKFGERPEIVHSIRSHHEEEKPETILDFIVQAADALSGARPGARREMLESYVKRVEDLEKIAYSFSGVEKAFAIQAGREVRVMVKSDDITDEGAIVLSRDIAKKVEEELSYPGQVRITVIRETRAVGVAK
ncbi:MAG: ribonuclease Y [Proteobacteria bacterium]|nr:ribonuclease Y [Pseudomonadota bacterium]